MYINIWYAAKDCSVVIIMMLQTVVPYTEFSSSTSEMSCITKLASCIPSLLFSAVICSYVHVCNALFLQLQFLISNPGMCPGLREWWLHKRVINLQNLVILNVYAPTVSRIPCRQFFV